MAKQKSYFYQETFFYSPKANIRVQFDGPFFVVCQIGLLERIRENEHKRVISAIVVVVYIGMRVAHFLQDLLVSKTKT